MTHQTLKQRADEILELDKKRTQGEWANYSTGDIWAEDINDSVYTECGSRNAIKNEDRNFIAAAPRMAQLIREQQERIEELENPGGVAKPQQDSEPHCFDCVWMRNQWACTMNCSDCVAKTKVMP